MTNAPADKINEQGRYEWQWLSDNHNTRPNQIKVGSRNFEGLS